MPKSRNPFPGERIDLPLTPLPRFNAADPAGSSPLTDAAAASRPAPRNKGGRPKKIAKMSIEDAENAIASELPRLLERLNDLAMGVIVAVIERHEEEDPETGEIRDVPEQRVYRMPPDKDALKYLTERVMGRVPQRLELSGELKETFRVIPWMPRDDAEKRKLVGPIIKRITAPGDEQSAEQVTEGRIVRSLDGTP